MVGDAAQQVQAWWAPALAFAAGVVSFASPCVLPLVPGYLALLTGGTDPTVRDRRRLIPILLFILGFSVVFTLVFGFAATSLSRAIRSQGGQRVAGVLVLLFGIFMLLYAFRARIPWLYREGRPFLSRFRPGKAGAFPLGMAFAVGWTPCIGPVLGAILTLAANQGSTARTMLLLLFYSMGLGVPFLLVGLGLGRLLTAGRFFGRNYSWFAGVSGVALVTIGVLLISGTWVRLIAPLFRVINRFTPAI
ncbi:MAG: sulfite exporter TauE/SafE family protein [Actinobacteria bacterium]|nr:sulfite exporter TauE/SafE family protein [Actinomycetota bacterium]